MRGNAGASASKLGARNSLQSLINCFRRVSSAIRHRKGDPLSASTATEQPSSCSIARLPDELLLHIFDYVHYNTFSRVCRNTAAQWLQVCHVCARWRYIIMAEARLWHVITVCQKLKVLRLFLSLRGDASLNIHFTSFDSLPPPIKLLQPHRFSVRVLKLCLRKLDRASDTRLRRILSIDLPNLEDLCIWPDAVINQSSDHSSLDLVRYPSLRHLKLRGLVVPADPTQLHSLVLQSCSWTLSPFDHFLDKLRQCQRLNKLYLDRSFHPFRLHLIIYGLRPLNPVALDCLRSLRIIDECPLVICAVLQYMSTPSVADLRLYCDGIQTRRDSDERSPPTRTHVFRAMLPLPQPPYLSMCIPDFGENSVIACVSAQDSLCALTLVSASPHKTIQLGARIDPQWNPALSSALEDLMYLFPTVHITILSLEGRSYHISPAVWAEVLSGLSHLRTLDLSGNGTWISMWHGLVRTRPRSSFSWNYGKPEDGLNRCRRLKVVRIRHVPEPEENHPAPPDERDIDIMRGVLCQRAAWKMELEELTWAVHSSRHANYDTARVTFLARFDSLVGRVRYEDLDRGM